MRIVKLSAVLGAIALVTGPVLAQQPGGRG